jgi:hypothetical protein
LLAHGSTDLTQLALRVSALEQQAALQQQNNEIMLRLINALSPQAPSAPVAPSSDASGVMACAVITPSEEKVDIEMVKVVAAAEGSSSGIEDLAHNGIRRAAF